MDEPLPLNLLLAGFRDPGLEALWWAELDRYDYEDRDWEAADCAELADEIAYLDAAIVDEQQFMDSYCEWHALMCDRTIWLPLEQSCHEGVLLPPEQRAVRLASCPEELLQPLRWLFELCPAPVKAHLALRTYVALRSERARRTGSPEWRPQGAKPAEPEPPGARRSFVWRKYSG